MKKLLGGIFQKQKDPQSSPGATLSPHEKNTSVGSAGSASSHGALRAVNPPVDNMYKHGPRSNWDSFFSSHVSARASQSPSQTSAVSSVPVPAKVFNQNLEMLMREIVTKTKLVITQMIDDADFQAEFAQLCGFINLAADKLLEKDDPSLVLLKNYFSSPAGMSLCEQTAFPSLVLDFVDKVRIYLIKSELKSLEPESTTQSSATTAAELERPIHFLMSCVQAIASNATLMELFRCELPNVIYLTAEDYPSNAVYLRDMSSQVLSSISDKNFNAGLVWYLNDCNTIGRTVKMMLKYGNAAVATRVSAADAMTALISATRSPIAEPQVSSTEPIAAAVGDALGLNRSDESENIRHRRSESVVEGSDVCDQDQTASSPAYQVVSKYEPLPGLKSLVFTLQKTCRYSLVLLGEFQSSGGYNMMTGCVLCASDSEISNIIYLFMLLLPLGTGYSGVCGDNESMATVNTCGARNIGAFFAFRDLVLKTLGELREAKDSESRARLELIALQLLTTILQVYTSAYDNFLCLEQKTQALAMIMTKLPIVDFFDAQVIILRIVEYVCVAAKPDTLLPIEVLAVLCNQFVELSIAQVLDDLEQIQGSAAENGCVLESAECLPRLLCECITRILQNATLPAFREELNAFGLLERGVYSMFVKVASSIAGSDARSSTAPLYLQSFRSRLASWSAITVLMLKDSATSCAELREMQIHHSLYVIAEALLNNPSAQLPSSSNLPVFSILISLSMNCTKHRDPTDECAIENVDSDALQSGIECDLAKLLEFLQSARRSSPRFQFVLGVIKQMMRGDEPFWRAWHACQGYEILVSMLSSFQGLDKLAPGQEEEFKLLDAVLEILCVTLDPVRVHNQRNLEHFSEEIGYATVAGCLVTSGVLHTEHCPSAMNRVFELVTGQANPRNKVRNPYAVQALLCLLPHLSAVDGEASLKRLVSKIACNDDLAFSRKKQIAILVSAGVFRWLAEPCIISLLQDFSQPLQAGLLQFLIEVSREALSTHHLREYVRVVAKAMPALLGNYYHPSAAPNNRIQKITDDNRMEVGLHLLQEALKGSVVPQVIVGTNARTRMMSGYVTVSTHGEKRWPPPNGYSLSCWLRFPPAAKKRRASDPPVSGPPSTVFVALCEGLLAIKLEGDDAETAESYCVLVGAELSIFQSAEAARGGTGRGQGLVQSLTVTGVDPTSTTEFVICCDDRRYVARSSDAEKNAVWIRALQQSENISHRTAGNVKAAVASKPQDEVVFVARAGDDSEDTQVPEDGADGYTCLMSAYSSEFSGCFTRIFFDQATACLRVDSGSASSGPNVNAALRRNSVLFKNVSIELLRPEGCRATDCDEDAELAEKIGHWHHIAVTHRKSALGNSQVVLYIDGAEVATKKLSYPSAPALSGLQAFLGKDIQVCGTYPALPWNMGPTWCVEDVLHPSAIVCVFLLGPSFAGQFSGHAYRSVGDWPEAIATCQLDRATKRRVEISRVARRLQLVHLSKAARRLWYESGNTSSSSGLNDLQLGNALSELLMKKSDEQNDGGSANRPSDAKRKQQKVDEFAAFVASECGMALFGLEILDFLSSFKLPEDQVLFSINTTVAHTASTVNGDPNSNGATIQFIGTERSTPMDLAKAAPALGGVVQLLLPLIENSWRSVELTVSLKLLVKCVRRNPSLLAELLELNAYALVMNVVRTRAHLVNEAVVKAVVRLSVSGALPTTSSKVPDSEAPQLTPTQAHPLIVDTAALSQILLSRLFRHALAPRYELQLINSLKALLDPENPNAIFNGRQLRRAGFVSWVLTYLADMCNNESTLDVTECLQLRSCFPTFQQSTHTKILEHLVESLTTYLHLENHVDDIGVISEHLLLSLSPQASIASPASAFRVVILQILLHEAERDAQAAAHRDDGGVTCGGKKARKEDGADPVSATMVEAVLYRGLASLKIMKKKKDRQEGVTSPTLSGPVSTTGDSLELVLLEIIRRFGNGCFGTLESLLAARLLLSLCQSQPSFAQLMLHSPSLLSKLKRALSPCSADCNFFTPILAYLSNIPIGETKYHDAVLAVDGPQQFALPTANGFLNQIERRCLDQVWELLGSLLIHNTQLESDTANRVLVIILTQLSFQVEVNDGFFATVCYSSFPVLRLVTQCLLRQCPQQKSASVGEEPAGAEMHDPEQLQRALACLIAGQQPDSPYQCRAVACLDFLKTYITRSLFDREDFAKDTIFLLECIDNECTTRDSSVAQSHGQKCWLALLVNVVKQTKALGENCSLSILKNLCTLSLGLARYLVSETKHQVVQRSGHENSSSSADPTAASCFGVDVLVFFLSTVRLSAEPTLVQKIGADDQQFFFACFVYCAQIVLLSELNGIHKSTSPPQRLLDCVLTAKQLFVQQTKVSGVMICGNSNHQHSTDADAVSGTARSGINAHLNKMKSLTTGAFHREFGIGAESDRNFVLSLTSELLRWLVDDSESVRYASIELWQFLIQHRAGVLKELLIVEPKVSLLQNISANKKEVIDVFRGGFDCLLLVSIPQCQGRTSSATRVNSHDHLSASSRESWLQFHNWLTENFELLKDLILTRTDPIIQHMNEVILSCESVRKVNLNANATRMAAHGDWSLHLDFRRLGTDPRSQVIPREEDSDGPPDTQMDPMCRIAARKAVLKFTAAQESAKEEIRDAATTWREIVTRLQNTRAIWHLGGWNEATKQAIIGGQEPSTSRSASRPKHMTNAEPFYLERTVFQQNSFKYRLDYTEGPQRLRLRLARSYVIDTAASEAAEQSVAAEKAAQGTTPSKTDPLQQKLQFHQCIETYRNFMYKRARSVSSDSQTQRQCDVRIIRELTAFCNVARLKAILQGLSESDDEADLSACFATAIFSEFLDNGQSSVLNVSVSTVEEISSAIASANNSSEPSPLASTPFNTADRELMQATLIVGNRPGRQTTTGRPDTEMAESDDEDDDDPSALSGQNLPGPHVLSESEESDSDTEAKSARFGSKSSRQTDSGRVESTKGVAVQQEEVVLGVDSDEKVFDSSADYVYGGVARFLRREDYPPLRSFNAGYVVGMSKIPGVFLICQNAIYFIGGYGKVYNNEQGSVSTPAVMAHTSSAPPPSGDPTSPTKGSTTAKKKPKDFIRDTFVDIGLSFPGAKSDAQLYTIVPLEGATIGSATGGAIERWSIKYANVKQFYRIKYQLRPVGIEFFDIFGSTFFLQYESVSDREEIVKVLFQMPIVNSVFWNSLLRSSALSLSVKRIRQALTKRWLKGGISNFEYLMHLNTLAGRSFNDITQYPVFPWVLADYTSSLLDLNDPASYRDLTKPMGALGENRAALFRERFAALNHDSGHGPMDTPAFHYGTHYSCSAYVINYLIRLEPFSQLARDLQGGSFDHADRLFRSIPSSWVSASAENLQDVRELIPEFFFLPEFLYNANKYDLGTTQSGEVVSHVKLPPWAHRDPREFIRLHRSALESRFVSENLHHWIDLVFGYKQTGPEALDAQNVFMHFTYEGAVDLDEIDDPVMRAAMVAQIENFGQTPSKLFTAPHPARRVPMLSAPPSSSINGASSIPTSPVPSSIGQPYEGNTMGSIEAFIKWHTPLAPALISIGKDYVFLKKQQSTNMLEAAVGDVQVVNDKFLCRGTGCTFVPPRFSKFLEWGRVADGTMKVRVHNSSARHREANKIVGVIEGAHHSRVNCAAFSDDGAILVTGGEDAVVNVLECFKEAGRRLFKQLAKLVGHEDAVTSVAIDRSFNLIASASSDGCVILWDLRTRTFLRELGGHLGAVLQVGINSANANVVSCTASEIRLWSVNGDLLAATTVQSAGLGPVTRALSTDCESWQNGVVTVTGHANGTIALWGLLYPSDLARERQSKTSTADVATGGPVHSANNSGTLKTAVRVSVGMATTPTTDGGVAQTPTVLKAIPSCRFAIKKLLVDHRTMITALTLAADQRQLVSGDSDGNCIRWVDDSVSTYAI